MQRMPQFFISGVPRSLADEDDKPSTQVELILPKESSRGFEMADSDHDDSDDDDDDTIKIIPLTFNFRPFRFELSPVFSHMRDWMKMMSDLFNEGPSFGPTTFNGFNGFNPKPWGKVPDGANTTSTTKEVDGQIVTVNETTYTDNSENGGTFIRFRVVQIQPKNETTLPGDYDVNTDNGDGEELDENTNNRSTEVSTKEDTTSSRSVETVEDVGNEIPRSQGDILKA